MGRLMLALSIIFVYFAVWLVIYPFFSLDSSLLSLFPNPIYGALIGCSIVVILVSFATSFILMSILTEKRDIAVPSAN